MSDEAASHRRSFNDPLSNLVFLSSVQIDRHIRQIDEKDLPPESLPVFLHEVTHHWCMSSPVGIAEMLLFFRARRAAVQYARTRGDQHWDVLDAVERYEFTQGLMRPLFEGLALFAEHDACPGRAKTASIPMILAGGLYAKGLAIRREPAYSKMPLVLAGSRLTVPHIRRKANLLMQPLDFSGGGYLAGYLTVKALWAANLFHVIRPEFLDSDFFLQFARSFFFDDWNLVACLLDDSRSDAGALGPISQAIVQRLVAMGTGAATEKIVEEFERSGQRDRPKVELHADLAHMTLVYDHVGQDEETIRTGQQRLQAAFRELFDVWPSDPLERQLIRLDLATLQLSSTVTLAHGAVDAKRIDGDLAFTSPELRGITMPAPSAIPAGWSGQIEIDVVTGVARPGLYLFVTFGDQIVAQHSLGNNAVPDELAIPLINARLRLAASQEAQAAVNAALDDPSLQLVREHTSSELARLHRKIYLGRALFGVPDSSFDAISQQTSKRGLLPLLQNDVDDLIDCAAVSLIAPLKFDPGMVHPWRRGDKQSTIARLNTQLAASLGMEPFFTMDKALMASFV